MNNIVCKKLIDKYFEYCYSDKFDKSFIEISKFLSRLKDVDVVLFLILNNKKMMFKIKHRKINLNLFVNITFTDLNCDYSLVYCDYLHVESKRINFNNTQELFLTIKKSI
jgi:hypothetical protein